MFDGAKRMLLMPMLKQHTVVDDVWKSMTKGAPLLVMPWTSRLNRMISGLLPIKVRDFYFDRAGVYHSMDEFTGHIPGQPVRKPAEARSAKVGRRTG